MNEAPRYATLRDYLNVLRRQRWLLASIIVAFAGAAFVISETQAETYEAEASLSFRDIGRDLNLLGTVAPPQFAPEQLAAENAQLIDRPGIARRASARLDGAVSPDEIQSDVSAQVGGPSNLVNVLARSEDPATAAEMANAVAIEASRLARRTEARRIDRAIETLRREIEADGAAGLSSGQLRDQIAQLATVKTIAQPVRVAELAEVPTAAVSPRPLRSTFLGGLLGLALGLLVVFARDSLDRRLRSAHDVHEELGLPVLGKISNSALGMSGFVRNGRPGAADTDLEAFRMLRTNLEFLDSEQQIRTILITSGLPEEGKSTVALGLASAAAVAGRRTLLVECDLRRPSLADRLGIRRDPGLSDYLLGTASPAEILQTVPIAEAGANGHGPEGAERQRRLVCITAGKRTPQPAELLGSARCRGFLSNVTDAYDLVVIDTSPLLSVVDALELVPHVDGVIVCVRAAQTTREEAKAAKAALERLPSPSMGAVVTGIRPGDDETYDYYYAYGR